ncbi:hypothetical protein X888_3001 [Burkholderia pseudomallei MSHR4377]|uniref:hypothetical protein n=1 Tax=Burkholderia pseudomallei TaxID=28450 RepID=UPI0005381460|nr:hypothetical protein [Burkholderia pseudomallei]KGU94956.1 hypothetical protein X888_3001 [Burkholderia pseudomallei MSHR4377]
MAKSLDIEGIEALATGSIAHRFFLDAAPLHETWITSQNIAHSDLAATYGQSCETCGDTNPLCCITVTEPGNC